MNGVEWKRIIPANIATATTTYSEQGHCSARIHPQGFEKGKTCIDCHKDIAHELPEFDEAEVNAILNED